MRHLDFFLTAIKEVKQGIYSTGGHSNKQEKERGRQGGQVYRKEVEH